MITKAFEIRDAATFIPVIATKMTTGTWLSMDQSLEEAWAENYLLKRSGYGGTPCILLCRMQASGVNRNATYDAYAWGGDGTRTMTVAHLYIEEHFDRLNSGDVVDVEFIVGETTEPKRSERLE